MWKNCIKNLKCGKFCRCNSKIEDARFKNLDLKQLNKMMKEEQDIVLLDVRSIQEYNEGHLLGAIHLADYEISVKHGNILPDKNAQIIVYCQNGGRSKKAYKKLKKLGYTNIYNLCGGLDNINEI